MCSHLSLETRECSGAPLTAPLSCLCSTNTAKSQLDPGFFSVDFFFHSLNKNTIHERLFPSVNSIKPLNFTTSLGQHGCQDCMEDYVTQLAYKGCKIQLGLKFSPASRELESVGIRLGPLGNAVMQLVFRSSAKGPPSGLMVRRSDLYSVSLGFESHLNPGFCSVNFISLTLNRPFRH